MLIRVDWRDTYPKLGLRNRFVGDGYPACWDLPSRAFLRKGARYSYIGLDPRGKMQPDHARITDHPLMVLDESSSRLFELLCGGRGTGATCDNMRGEVTLMENIACSGNECDVETVRTVQVNRAGKKPVYFEYIRVPCVEFAFVDDDQARPASNINYVNFIDSQCIDQRLHAASGGCCTPSTGSRNAVNCGAYGSERTSAPEAMRRCNATDRFLCERENPIFECGRHDFGMVWGTS